MAKTNHNITHGHIGERKGTNLLHQYIVVDDKVVEIHKLIVHRFNLGDVEDPDLYAAHPIIEWQQTEQGKWVMEHSIETPMWHRHVDYSTYGYHYAIQAWLKGPDYTFYQLKWGQTI